MGVTMLKPLRQTCSIASRYDVPPGPFWSRERVGRVWILSHFMGVSRRTSTTHCRDSLRWSPSTLMPAMNARRSEDNSSALPGVPGPVLAHVFGRPGREGHHGELRVHAEGGGEDAGVADEKVFEAVDLRVRV